MAKGMPQYDEIVEQERFAVTSPPYPHQVLEDKEVLLEWDDYARLQRRRRRLFLVGVSFASLTALAVLAFGSWLAFTSFSSTGSSKSPIPLPANMSINYQDYPSCSWNEDTLPSFIRPINYETEFQVNCDDIKYVWGHTIITADILEDTPCAVLHARDMGIWQVHQHSHQYEGVEHGEHTLPGLEDGGIPVPELGLLRMRYNNMLPRPISYLHIRFNYTLADGERGAVLTNVTDENGVESTHILFKPFPVRDGFAIFDQKDLKVSWNLTVAAPAAAEVTFNTDPMVVNTQVLHLAVSSKPFRRGIPEGFLASHFRPTVPIAPSELNLTISCNSPLS